jgi:hypothetical protein
MPAYECLMYPAVTLAGLCCRSFSMTRPRMLQSGIRPDKFTFKLEAEGHVVLRDARSAMAAVKSMRNMAGVARFSVQCGCKMHDVCVVMGSGDPGTSSGPLSAWHLHYPANFAVRFCCCIGGTVCKMHVNTCCMHLCMAIAALTCSVCDACGCCRCQRLPAAGACCAVRAAVAAV